MRIVLCDDDHTCCKKYTWLLRKIKEEYSLDFTIEICNNGKQLLFLSEDLLSSDIILLDIMMPGMDGSHGISLGIRKTTVRTIFIASLADKMLEAFDVLAYHYIIKDSVSKEKFEEIILKAVKQSEEESGEQLITT